MVQWKIIHSECPRKHHVQILMLCNLFLLYNVYNILLCEFVACAQCSLNSVDAREHELIYNLHWVSECVQIPSNTFLM